MNQVFITPHRQDLQNEPAEGHIELYRAEDDENGCFIQMLCGLKGTEDSIMVPDNIHVRICSMCNALYLKATGRFYR